MEQRFGHGIEVTATHNKTHASATIRDCLVEANRSVGMEISNATVKVERSVVMSTLAEKKRGLYGDGISVEATSGSTARMDLTDSLVQGSARAGAVFFGAQGSVNRSVLRSGKFSIVLEQNAIPEIGADNVYEQNQLNQVSVGQNLEPAPIPPVPKR